MNLEQKTQLLATLRDEIIASIPDSWLFPENGMVRGFLGPGPLMLVAERPSTGGGAQGGHPRLLYDLLEKHGAANAHLTDLIKSRARADAPYPADMSLHRRIFDRELEIVAPRVIVTFGKKVYDLLQFSLAGSGITIRPIWHYAYARRGADKAREFEKQIRDALRDLISAGE